MICSIAHTNQSRVKKNNPVYLIKECQEKKQIIANPGTEFKWIERLFNKNNKNKAEKHIKFIKVASI